MLDFVIHCVHFDTPVVAVYIVGLLFRLFKRDVISPPLPATSDYFGPILIATWSYCGRDPRHNIKYRVLTIIVAGNNDKFKESRIAANGFLKFGNPSIR